MARRFCRTNGCAMSHLYIVSLPKLRTILEQIVMMNRGKEKLCVYCLCLSFSFSLSLWWWREENQKWCVFIVFRSPPHGCLLRTYLIWRWVGIFENIVSSRYKEHFLWHQYSLIKKCSNKANTFKQREIYDLIQESWVKTDSGEKKMALIS